MKLKTKKKKKKELIDAYIKVEGDILFSFLERVYILLSN
jgi:hypothetical protein